MTATTEAKKRKVVLPPGASPPPAPGEKPEPDFETVEMPPEQINALQRAHANFLRNIPPGAAAAGSWDPEAPPPPAAEPKALEVEGLADGKYRVGGSDWIMEGKGGKVSFRRGRPEDDPTDITTLPDTPVAAPQETASQAEASTEQSSRRRRSSE